MRKPWERSGGRKGRRVSGKSFAARRKLAPCEPLEERSMMAVLYWDPNGTAAGVGGSGTWDTSAAVWTTDPNGLTGHVAWNNSAGDTAVFAGSAGAVDLGLAVAADRLQYNSNGYSIDNYSVTLNSTAEIEVGIGATATLGSVLSGSAGLSKLGDGTLVLASASSYTGTTQVDEGTLVFQDTYASTAHQIATGAVLELQTPGSWVDYIGTTFTGAGTLRKTGSGSAMWGSGATTFDFDSGALIDVQSGTLYGGSYANEDWTSNASDLNVASGAVFNGVEANIRVGALSGSGTIRSGYIGAGYSTFTFGVGDVNGTFAGTLAHYDGVSHGHYTKTGAGTQSFTGTINQIANEGNTGLTIAAGTIEVSGAGTFAGGAWSNAIVNNGTFKYNSTVNNTLSGTISGTGALVKETSSTLTLSGANTYSGTTTVDAGTLRYQGGNASTAHAIASGAVLELNVASGASDYGATTFTGAGTLRKTGSGSALWGLGAATFAFDIGALIDVQAGTLYGGSCANEDWTSNLADLNVATGAEFNGVEANVLVGALTGSGTIRSGYIGAGYSTFTFGVGDASGTFAGTLSHYDGTAHGHYTKTGTGTQTFTGTINQIANEGNTGLTIAAGTIEVSGAGTFAGGTWSNAIVNNGTFKYNSTVNNTLNGTISGSGALVKDNSGALTLSGQNTFTGDLSVDFGTINASAGQNVANATAGALGNPQASRNIVVSADATLRFTAHDVLGNAASTPQASILVDGGTVTSANGIFNTFGPITLEGGTLDSGTPNATYGSYKLTDGLTARGTETARLKAKNMVLPAGSPGIVLEDGVRLEQTGNFDSTPASGKSTVVTQGDGTRAEITSKKEYRILGIYFHKGESSATYNPEFANLTPQVPEGSDGWISAASLADALQKALSFTFTVNGVTGSFGAGGDNKNFESVPDVGVGLFGGSIGFEDWTDADYNDAYITYSIESREATSEDPTPDCPCECACSPANPDSAGSTETNSPGDVSLKNDSGTVNGNKVVKATARLNPDQDVPDLVEVRLSFNGVEQPSVFLDPTGFAPGDYYTASALANTSILATGRYDWKMTLVSHYGDTKLEEVIDGHQDVVNRTESEFGNGWWLPELDQLNLETGGVNLITGLNQAVWFAENGASYTVESGNPPISSLVQNGDDSFTVSYSDGSRSEFSQLGLLTSRVAANGNTRTYAYADEDGDTVADELVSITDESGRVATLSYTSGKVTQIEGFTGQVTSYAFTGDNLTAVTETDPDGGGPQASPVTAYDYNGDGLLSKVTDPLGNESEVFYDFTGRVSSVEQSCGGTTTLQSYLTVSLPNLDVIGYDAAHPAPMVSAAETLEYQEDERGNPKQVVRDHYGNVIKEIDVLGHVTTYRRDANGLVTRMTEQDSDGAGPLGDLVTEFEYDSKGNLLNIIHADASEESWTYDATFSQVTSHVDQLGRTTNFEIDPVTGDVLSITQVVGLDDTASSETDDVTTSFTFTDGTGGVPAGLVETITDPLGRVKRYTYNTHGIVTSIVAAEGTADETLTEFEYDAADNLTAMIDPLGRRTEYDYDALDRMIQMTEADPDGAGPLTSPVWTYEYDARGNQRFVTDPLGNVTEYVYNERNWVEQKIEADPDGAGSLTSPITTYDYDCVGNLVSVIDPLGRETTFTYDALNRLIETTLPDPDDAGPLASPVSSQTYDALGNVVTQTDALSNVTSYRYDAMSRMVEVTEVDPDGAGSRTSPVTTYEYDDAGQLISTTDPLGRVTSYEYDDLGRMVNAKLPDADVGPSSIVYETAYDKVGNVASRTDALGNVTAYGYDNLDRLVHVVEADPDGDGPLTAPETAYEYDDAGQLSSVTDPLGRVTGYEYDNLGRQIAQTLPDPDGAGPLASPVYTTTYDAVGNVLTQTDALGNVTTYGYDNLYRTITVAEADPDGAGPLISPVTSYDFDTVGQLTGTTDPLGRTTTYTYDDLGRTIEVLSPDPDGAGPYLAPRMTYTYDAVGNLLSATDRLDQTTEYAYDNLYRRTTIADANGEETLFNYDAVGNRVVLTDPEGNTTTWAYDGLNRVIEETNELDAPRYFGYDAVGNLIQKIDRNGRYTEYEYDNLYRRTEERWLDETDDTTVVHAVNWTFDVASQLTEAGDSFAGYAYSYDGLSRTTNIVAAISGLTPVVTLSQQFNSNGGRTQLAATIGSTDDFVNDYTYDNLDRMTKGTQHGVIGGNTVADKRADFNYNAAGQFDEISRYKDLSGSVLAVRSEYGYDGTGHILSITHKINGGSTAAGYTFGYDAANRITEFGNTQYTAETATISYDAIGQLTGADRTGTTDDEDYGYDANGNRETANADTYTTDPNNRLSSEGIYNYEYDAEGNRTKQTNIATGDYRTFAWDHRNRIVAVTDFDDSDTEVQRVEYVYDFAQRLVGRKVFLTGSMSASESQHFVYDGNQMTLVLDDAGAVEHRYLWGPAVDQILADEVATATSGYESTSWALTDHLNSVRDWLAEDTTTPDTFSIENHVTLDTFGRQTAETNGSAVDHLLSYTGRYTDSLTSLQWNLHRWYDPNVGRWLSEDWIWDDLQNPTRYVGNNAVKTADPRGLQKQPERLPPVEGNAENGYEGLGKWDPEKIWDQIKQGIPENARKTARELFDQGCVGLALLRLGIFDKGSDQFIKRPDGGRAYKMPQLLSGALVYSNLPKAKEVADKLNQQGNGHWIIVAWQQNTPILGDQGPDKPFLLPWQTEMDERGGDFNFATLSDKGYWEYMNRTPLRRGCEVKHTQELPDEKVYKHTAYIVVKSRA